MDRVAVRSGALLWASPIGRTSLVKAGRTISCRTGSARYSNPIGVHQNVWVGGWSKEEVEETVNGSKEAGYDLVEWSVFDPQNIDVGYAKGLLEEAGLKASGSLGLTFDADISSESMEVVQRGKEMLLNALQAIHDVGGTIMCGVLYSAIGKYPGPPSRQGYTNCVNALKEVAARAADCGVTMGLEVINRYETNVLNTAEQGMQMLADINAPNVVIHLDTYHMNIEENSMDSAVRTCGNKLGYVHIGESHRGYLGTGSVDWVGLFQALASIEYRGPITFESFSADVVNPALSNNLCVWRSLWSESCDLAEHARGFIDAQLEAATIKVGLS